MCRWSEVWSGDIGEKEHCETMWSHQDEEGSPMKKMHLSEIEGVKRRGSPLGRWKDEGKGYMTERGSGRGGGFEQAKRKWLDKEK